MKAQYKIVFSGPVGAGKTTAITAISDRPPISTEQKATDETGKIKETTTVAMDYGSIRLADGNLINLYGTPGQQRFDFMWDILADGAIGLAIIVDHCAADPLADLATYVEAFREDFGQHNIVVGINKFRHGHGPGLEDYHRALLDRQLNSPVMEVDARDKSDVAMLLQALLFNIDPNLQSV